MIRIRRAPIDRRPTETSADHAEVVETALDLLLKPELKPRKVVVYGEPVYRESVRLIHETV